MGLKEALARCIGMKETKSCARKNRGFKNKVVGYVRTSR